MKKTLFLLLMLCGAVASKAQYTYWALPRDSLVRPTLEQILIRPDNLADTLKTARVNFDYHRDDWCERPAPDGGIEVTFQISPDSDTFGIQKKYYLFPVTLHRPLTPGICFEFGVDVAFRRDEGDDFNLYTWTGIRVNRDSIVTLGSPFMYGGITPEGQYFRFSGEDVERIGARAKGVYLLSEAIIDGSQDGWYEPVGFFSTPWIDCAEDRYGYRLPVANRLEINPEQFCRI